MTKHEIDLLDKYSVRRFIEIDDVLIVQHLEKMKLIFIDRMYSNLISSIVFEYAETTEDGKKLLEKYKPVNNPKKSLFSRIFKR